ncbi:hypothetical protein EWM64_g5034 [Hericium alpestre]|uniref:Cyclin-like domain-containing protein n=1 Tax=Hericium alpestre TaxID=135208 RepID=A0A4Y9ZVR9_9AGAM|nr:hypothetical protein EWM64_g5034 [Hericium alpestre]
MNATLPSLPTELLSTWAAWRPLDPLMPPLSAPPRRLPSIAHLDRALSRMSPSGMLNDASSSRLREPPARLPPVQAPAYAPPEIAHPLTPEPTPEPVIEDWFSESRHWSAHFLAEKTCEMICYLWFSKSSTTPSPTTRHNQSPPLSYFPHRNSKTAWLQFSVSSVFVQFMQKLLETTQVSQSVIVLSLHYIYRLKEHNCFTVPCPGSEFRVAVAGLMLANKFVDDNTYTNKTWSEVSGIGLPEVNKMEREFLAGVDFDLYVDKPTYDAWVNLLKGLVMAKEKDGRYWRNSRQMPRLAGVSKPVASLAAAHPRSAKPQRARSTSPSQWSRRCSPVVQPTQYRSPMTFMDTDSPLRSGYKRTAVDAFSPTSATFDAERPTKKALSLSLEIPESFRPAGPHSYSPSEPLGSFSKLSLGSSPASHGPTENVAVQVPPSSARHVSPQTLVTAYRLDPTKPRAPPQNLYFYSLACSPLTDDTRSRKGRLRYHQPPASSAPSDYAYMPPQPTNFVVQSASASPRDIHTMLPPVLPPGTWADHCLNAVSHYEAPASRTYEAQEPVRDARDPVDGSVPSAPFANAGPPGVHFYPTPVPQRSSPDDYYWRRGRRL